MWVEADGPCEVEVLGATERTFEVEGHHFALVHVTGLPAEGNVPYEVALRRRARVAAAGLASGRRAACARWPTTTACGSAFGSCRCAYPNEPPWTLTKDEDPEGRGHDALRALALRMRDQEPDEWPHLLLLLGDQVYADEVAPATEEFIRARRDVDVPPGLQISDFEEYCRLYRDAWCEPAVRWLLSTVPTAMIFDDHDVIDDWNTSRDWVAQMRATGWWDERIVGAFMSYWCYQHLGNLSPEDREEDACYRAVRAAEGDAGPIVRDFAFRADREVAGARWSYKRDIGRTRIVMMDSRAGRVLEPGGRRWSTPRSGTASRSGRAGDFDHLLLGTSLPVFLGRGMHYLEAWNEAVADGAWGALASARGRAPAPGPRPRALGRVRRLAARARAAARRTSPRDGAAARPGASCCSPATSTTPTRRRRGPTDGAAGVAGARLPGRLLAAAQPAGRQRAARDQARR